MPNCKVVKCNVRLGVVLFGRGSALFDDRPGHVKHGSTHTDLTDARIPYLVNAYFHTVSVGTPGVACFHFGFNIDGLTTLVTFEHNHTFVGVIVAHFLEELFLQELANV
jgi:hypothetical protein